MLIFAPMASLCFINAFISDRLAEAAVEIFGAVEKTLLEYQEEIRRSKQEIDHLRILKLNQSETHQVNRPCWDHEVSPEHSRNEEPPPSAGQEQQQIVHIKEEHEGWADPREPFCRMKFASKVSSLLQNRKSHEASHLPLHHDQTAAEHGHIPATADIKSEPNSDECVTRPSTSEAKIYCDIEPDCSGRQQEALKDPLHIDRPNDQQCADPHWRPCQDHKDPDPASVKEEVMPRGPAEGVNCDRKLSVQSNMLAYDEPPISDPSQGRNRRHGTVYTAEEERGYSFTEGSEASALTGGSEHFCSASPETRAAPPEYSENTGECFIALSLNERRLRNRQKTTAHRPAWDGTAAKDDANSLSSQRRHKCPICGKRFRDSSHLKDHVRIHTGEKPFQCQKCGKNFRQRGTLTLHMRIHTGERPYQCSDCGRRFSRKYDMDSHKVTHTREKPHVCVACGKSFQRKGSLNAHLKSHVDDNMDCQQL